MVQFWRKVATAGTTSPLSVTVWKSKRRSVSLAHLRDKKIYLAMPEMTSVCAVSLEKTIGRLLLEDGAVPRAGYTIKL